MEKQGHEERTGTARITPAYNLPCKYILHTVGPLIRGWLTKKEKDLLASCYRACLELAEKNGVQSIAFCCIGAIPFLRGLFTPPVPSETVKRFLSAVQAVIHSG